MQILDVVICGGSLSSPVTWKWRPFFTMLCWCSVINTVFVLNVKMDDRKQLKNLDQWLNLD